MKRVLALLLAVTAFGCSAADQHPLSEAETQVTAGGVADPPPNDGIPHQTFVVQACLTSPSRPRYSARLVAASPGGCTFETPAEVTRTATSISGTSSQVTFIPTTEDFNRACNVVFGETVGFTGQFGAKRSVPTSAAWWEPAFSMVDSEGVICLAPIAHIAASNPELVKKFGTYGNIRWAELTSALHRLWNKTGAAPVDVHSTSAASFNQAFKTEFGLREYKTSFDAGSYTAAHPDLVGAFGYNPSAATKHYVEYGVFESRSTYGFDASGYVASHGDLIEQFGSDVEAEILFRRAATRHYLEFGQREGRSIGFSCAEYLRVNPDLSLWFGADPNVSYQCLGLKTHCISKGWREGRGGGCGGRAVTSWTGQ